jgi:hypothetical protein
LRDPLHPATLVPQVKVGLRRGVGVAITLVILSEAPEARAIRPFITDDAHVVGKGHLQLETYLRRDASSAQQWILPAIGPTDWLEVTLGGVHGVGQLRSHPDKPTYAVAGPILQGKFLLLESVPNKPPGLAIVVGGITPAGSGGFQAPGWSGFSYLALTQAFIREDDLLFHVNVGVSTISAPGFDPVKVTWGVGTQIETLFNFHLIGELFSGDPYAQGSGGAVQGGFRIIFNDHLQLDGTLGSGVWGDNPIPLWFSSGIRIVSHELF